MRTVWTGSSSGWQSPSPLEQPIAKLPGGIQRYVCPSAGFSLLRGAGVEAGVGVGVTGDGDGDGDAVGAGAGPEVVREAKKTAAAIPSTTTMLAAAMAGRVHARRRCTSSRTRSPARSLSRSRSEERRVGKEW